MGMTLALTIVLTLDKGFPEKVETIRDALKSFPIIGRMGWFNVLRGICNC